MRKNPEKRSKIMIFQNAKRRSRIKANGGEGYTIADWREVKKRFSGMCAYCEKTSANSIDHFVPLARGGLHDYRNIVPACNRCNSRKRENEPTQWIEANCAQGSVQRIKSKLLQTRTAPERTGTITSQPELIQETETTMTASDEYSTQGCTPSTLKTKVTLAMITLAAGPRTTDLP